MPTQTGTIWAQWVGYSTVVQNAVHTYTIFPSNRTITAEAAIALHSSVTERFWAETGISEIIANDEREVFDPPLPRIQRTNVTSITFRTASTEDTRVYGRHVIYYWT
jgi:hypothetical protein